jgi:hypothetical protein
MPPSSACGDQETASPKDTAFLAQGGHIKRIATERAAIKAVRTPSFLGLEISIQV